jgi:hypothetical protein
MLVVMVGEAYVATVATRHPSAGFTFEHGGISPSVLEEDNLLALHEGIAHGVVQEGREGAIHTFSALLVLDVYNFDVG